jgi:AcrR family transcriptional regulator
VHVSLSHARREEQLVVHGEPEQDAHEDHRQEAQDRAGLDPERFGEPSPLEDRDDRPIGGEQRQDEPAGRDERHEDRAEHQDHDEQRQAHDHDEVDRQHVREVLGDGAPRNEEARLAILQATANQFTTRHYEHLTVEGIAADAGVSKQTIYRWWPIKGALIAEAMIEGFLFSGELTPPDTGDLRLDLETWLNALFEFVQDERNDALVRSLVAAGAENAEVGNRLNEALGAASTLITRLESGIETAELRTDAPLTEVVDALLGAFIVRTLTRTPTDAGTASRLVDAVLGPASASR